jgi:hypothetical protein
MYIRMYIHIYIYVHMYMYIIHINKFQQVVLQADGLDMEVEEGGVDQHLEEGVHLHTMLTHTIRFIFVT